ncbi:RICIN domain-containing protein [Streptomyces sp. NPDC002643]
MTARVERVDHETPTATADGPTHGAPAVHGTQPPQPTHLAPEGIDPSMTRVRTALSSHTARVLATGLTFLSITVAGVATVDAAPRGAADPSGTSQALAAPRQTFQNDATKRCLDDHGGLGNLRTFPCNNTDFQKWEVFTVGSARVLKNVATARCLDDHGGLGNLRTFACNDSDFQKWQVAPYEGGAIQIKSVATGRCLDDHGGLGNLRTFGCNWQHYQAWR